MSVYIVTDSTSDIPEELVAELPIIVVPLYVILNGKSYLDKIDLTRKTFYESLPTSNPHASTATPAPDQFTQAYDQAADMGAEAIFSIHISQSLSATYQSAETAAKKYTRIPVYPVDSGNLTLAEGLIVIKAAEAAKDGKSVEEIRSIIQDEEHPGRTQILGPVPSPMARKAGQYRFQMLFQSDKRQDLHALLKKLIPEIERIRSSNKVRWSLDVDPVDLY